MRKTHFKFYSSDHTWSPVENLFCLFFHFLFIKYIKNSLQMWAFKMFNLDKIRLKKAKSLVVAFLLTS